MTPRERVLRSLQGERATPVACLEHGLSPGIVEEAYGVKLPPVSSPPGTPEHHQEYMRQQIEMNRNGRYIAASSNSIPHYCKPDNVKVFFDEIAKLA